MRQLYPYWMYSHQKLLSLSLFHYFSSFSPLWLIFLPHKLVPSDVLNPHQTESSLLGKINENIFMIIRKWRLLRSFMGQTTPSDDYTNKHRLEVYVPQQNTSFFVASWLPVLRRLKNYKLWYDPNKYISSR